MLVWSPHRVAGMILLACLLSTICSRSAQAQIVPAGEYLPGDAVASLEDQLINRLRANEEQQRGYIRRVTTLVREGRLEPRLVVAIYRYAIYRYPQYPFPYFERAMRFEAKKRGVHLPPVQLVARTPGEVRQLR